MKKLFCLICALVLFACLFAGCAPTQSAPADPGTETETKEPIRVGVLAPLTGSFAEYGTTFEVAMTMKAEEINAAGGINGRELSLEFADTKADQNQAADMAARFAEDEGIVAILGDFTSGCSMAAAPVCDEAGIVLLAPTGSNANFAPMSDWAFSVAGRASEESAYAARYAVQKYSEAKSVAVFYLNSDYGVSAFDAFKGGADACGLDICFAESYADGETDFSALITKARATNPDHVVIIDQASTSNIINQIRGAGWDIKITMVGISTNTQIISLCGENCEGVLATATVNFNESDPVTGPFTVEYTKRAGFGPTQMAGYAYDSTQILAEAIERCGDDITRENIREELAKTDGVYLTGPIKFTEIGDIIRTYLIYEIEDGAFVLKCGYDYAD